MLNSYAAARAQGVRWARPHLEELCVTIRRALENWAGEAQTDAPDLDQARTAASELRYALATLEVHADAALAANIVNALNGLGGKPDAQAAGVILEAIAMLPGNLERLETGAPDIAEIWHPIIERLQAIAGTEYVDEQVTTEIRPAEDPDLSWLDLPGEPYTTLSQAEIHRAYQRALRDWLKDENRSDQLIEVAQRLTHHESPAVRRLGHVARTGFTALTERQIEATEPFHHVLSGIDRLLGSRSGPDEEEANAIARELLTVLADAAESSTVVQSLFALYDQHTSSPTTEENSYSNEELARAQSVLAGRNRALFTAVAEAAHGELNQAKSTLNELLLGRAAPDVSIGQVSEWLSSVAESLNMLSLDRLATRVASQAEHLGRSSADANDPALQDIAHELLLVESELEESMLYMGEPPADVLLEGRDSTLPKAEHRRVMRQLVHEALDNLNQAKHQLDQQHRGQDDDAGAVQAAQILRHTASALHMAGLDHASELLEASAGWIESHLLDTDYAEVDRDQLESLAEALVVTEFYLDSLNRLDQRGVDYLDRARADLMEMGYLDHAREQEAGQESLTLAESGAVEADVTVEIEVETETEAEPEARDGDRILDSALLGEDFDLREIFLEEFDEQFETLQSAYPDWRDAQEDRSLLTDIRRAFHTLKGSGRMAGALQIGEFSWIFEQVLNRTLDREYEPEQVVELIGEAIRQLPELRNRFVEDPDAAMPQQAEALITQAGQIDQPKLMPELEGLDPTLIQLMIKEIGEHLLTIEQWVDSSRQQGWPQDVSGDLILSLHTIKGTLRLAPIGDEADSLQAVENYLQDVRDDEKTADDSAIELLADVQTLLGRRLDRLRNQTVADDHFQTAALAERANELAHALHQSAAPEDYAQTFPAELNQEQVQASSDEPELESVPEVEADEESIDAEFAEGDAAEIEATSSEPPHEPPLVTDTIDSEADEDALEAAVVEQQPEETEAVSTEASIEQEGPIEQDVAVEQEAPAELSESVETVEETAEYFQREEEEEERAELEAEAETEQPSESEIFESDDEMEVETESDAEPDESTEPPDLESDIRIARVAEFESWPESELGKLDTLTPADDQRETSAEETLPADAVQSGLVIDYAALDQDLLELFVEEGRERLESVDAVLQKWREQPDDRSLVTALQREVHTVKGSARMAGLNPVGHVAHVLEDMLESIAGGQQQATQERIDSLETGCDHLHAMIDAVDAREPLPEAPATETLEIDEDVIVETDVSDADLTPMTAASTDRVSTIRMDSTQIEELLNFAGEVSIFRSRIEQEIGGFHNHVSEIEQTVLRLRGQLRKLEQETETQILSRHERERELDDSTFDPLEMDRYSTIQQLSRALAESVSDLNSLTELMDNASRQSETLLMQQARVNTELQEGLMQARMVSFSTIAPRLRRVVRNAARDAGKQAELEIRLDGEGELDRNVLDRMTAPIEHILRNAIAHGLESPEQRRKVNKPETGRIVIDVEREATELIIRVRDDGAGLNLKRIRRRALEMGLLNEQQAENDDAVAQVIFQPGFSTADEVSELAGRGVGMDVVASETRQIGGRINVSYEPGQGARFEMRIPLSLAVMQAIFVLAGERSFAIPLQAVRGVARISPQEWQQALQGDASYQYGGEEYPLIELEPQLDLPPAEIEGGNLSLLMIATGDQRAAIRVAEIQGHREIVLKPVGPQISSITGVLAGTIMGDGQVVVILDIAPLIERAMQEQRIPGRIETADQAPAQEEVKRTPLVMVVDDSITMRRVTSRILEYHGLEVITARDGVEAVDLLYERVPDLMLLDIEMPRMDGFEVAAHVRDDTRLSELPIMMITSRSGDKHRDHARSLGVERYMIKPYQEANLVQNVFEMLGLPQPDARD